MTTSPAEPSVLGRRLQLTRAGHWFAGNQQDPYALILRAQHDDPSPYEEEVRAAGPFFHSTLMESWVTADGEVARTVLADSRFGTRTRDGQRPGAAHLPLAGPDGTDAEVAPASDAESAGAVTERVARGLLERREGGFDLAGDYARRLSTLVLAEVFGVPEEHRAEVTECLVASRRVLDSELCPQSLAVTTSGQAAADALEQLAARIALPGAALATAARAAVLATVLVCDAVRALLDRGQWAALCEDTGRAAAAVDETLLWHPPVRLASRVAEQDTEVPGTGTLVPADGQVVVLVAAAHRDLAASAGHAGLDITAPRDRGALLLPAVTEGPANRLARDIAVAALRVLAESAPALAPAGAPVRLRRAPVTLGHARLPVTRGSARRPQPTTNV